MEMSVGTIVTIVLLMGVLVLGLFLIKGIFSSAKGAVDLTDQQLQSEISKLFSEEKELVIYPTSGFIEIKQEETDAVGIGIKNLARGTGESSTFSYEIIARDSSDCGIEEEELESFIVVGRTESDIPIGTGDIYVARARIRIPTGAPLCIASFRVDVFKNGEAYARDSFDIEIKAA